MGAIDLLSHSNQKKIPLLLRWILLIIIICLGFYIRFIDLSTHFSHCDDNGVAYTILDVKTPKDISAVRGILAEKANYPRLKILIKLDQLGLLEPLLSIEKHLKIAQFFIIPLRWTYAPLQYIFTPIFISREQSYREILFWGRLPSFIFSILSLILLVPLYRLFRKGEYFQYLIFSLVLFTFSWEHIIYSKHMASYSIGVLSVVLILYLLLYNVEHVDFSIKRMLLHSFLLAILSHAQYQILIFVFAYYLSLFYYYLNKTEEKLKLIKNFSLSVIFYLVLIFPMYFLFLQHLSSRGTSYVIHAGKQFIFNFQPNAPLVEEFIKALLFFFKNSIIVLQSNLTFLPESHPFIFPMTCFFITLFSLGILSFFLTKNVKKQMIGLFFLILAILWAILILQKKIALGPTRHNLILLPCQVIILSEGLGFIFNKIKNSNLKHSLGVFFSLFFSCVIIFSFFANFQKVVNERRDYFNEKEIFNVLEKYKVSTIISYAESTNIALMLMNKKSSFNHFDNSHWQFYKKTPNYNLVAFISHHAALDKERFNQSKQLINSNPQSFNTFKSNLSEYKIIFSKEISSNAKPEFSNRIKILSNGYYFYILEKSKN